MQCAQGVLLFLERFNNSVRFQILHALTLATRSYALLVKPITITSAINPKFHSKLCYYILSVNYICV